MATSLQDQGSGVRQRATAKSSSKATAAELTPRPGNVSPRGPPPPFTVYAKLAFFSVGMFALPLGTYYALVGKYGTNWAGGAAALAANVVLIGYVIAAFLEDGDAGAHGAKGVVAAGNAEREKRK